MFALSLANFPYLFAFGDDDDTVTDAVDASDDDLDADEDDLDDLEAGEEEDDDEEPLDTE